VDWEGEDAGDDGRAAEEGEGCKACSVSCASSVNLVRSLAELRVVGILSIRIRRVIRKVSA
jgi:Asp/Glu/hydantoin racemase